MAGVSFDLLRQSIEALENLSMQAAQHTQTAQAQTQPAPAEQTAQAQPAAPEQPQEGSSSMTPDAPGIATAAPLARPDSGRSRARMGRAELRRAVILSEILAPPLARRRR